MYICFQAVIFPTLFRELLLYAVRRAAVRNAAWEPSAEICIRLTSVSGSIVATYWTEPLR